jgi:transcriptional regulator GlxA family with amidase domain
MSVRSFRPRISARTLVKSLAYLGALLVLPLVVGIAGLATKTSPTHPAEPPAFSQALPALAAHDPSKKTAVVLSSAYGAEINDFLPPYEILARSGAFQVYAVAPERKVLPLVNSNMAATSLDFIPHFSFDEYARVVGKAPDVIAIPWFPAYTAERDSALLDWIRANAGPQTTIVTICAGTEILADTGLLAGRTATTNTGWFGKLTERFPSTTWVKGVRYHEDGQIITSTNLASGFDATLKVVERHAGRAVAEDIARQIGYRYTHYLDDPRYSAGSMAKLGFIVVNAGYQIGKQNMGVVLYDGVSEVAISGILDLYGSSLIVGTHVVAPERAIVRSQHGLSFVPRADFRSAKQLDRVVLPAGEATDAMSQALAGWTKVNPGMTVEQIHRGVGANESAYEATLKDIARTQNAIVAGAVGQAMFYPTERLQFADAGWPVAPVFAPLTVALLGVGLVYAIRQRPIWRRAMQAA